MLSLDTDEEDEDEIAAIITADDEFDVVVLS